MHVVVRRAIQVALMTGGVLLVGAQSASADDGLLSGNLLSGNQVVAPVQVPVVICGNAIGVAGDATAGCAGTAATSSTAATNTGSGSSASDDSVGSDNQVVVPVAAPVAVSGNAVSVAGDSAASSKGTSTSGGTSASNSGAGGTREDSVASGNQVVAPVSAPVTVCGNAVGVLGDAKAQCEGTSKSSATSAVNSGGGGSHSDRVASGNQVVAPVSAPVTVCGNAVGVFGDAAGSCQGASSAGGTSAGNSGNGGAHSDSVGAGNQLVAPVSAPVTVCGNAVGNASASCQGASTAGGTSAGNAGSGSHSDGVASGNQVVAPVAPAVLVCGNAVGVLGDAGAHCGGTSTSGDTHVVRAGTSWSKGDSVGSGNQVIVPVTAPVTVCGNAVGVLGDASASCQGASTSGGANPGTSGGSGSGSDGVGSGNQVVVPVTAPVTVCGNAAGVLGDASAACGGTSTGGGTPSGTTGGTAGSGSGSAVGTPSAIVGVAAAGSAPLASGPAVALLLPATSAPRALEASRQPAALPTGISKVLGVANGPVRALARTGAAYLSWSWLAGMFLLLMGAVLRRRPVVVVTH